MKPAHETGPLKHPMKPPMKPVAYWNMPMKPVPYTVAPSSEYGSSIIKEKQRKINKSKQKSRNEQKQLKLENSKENERNLLLWLTKRAQSMKPAMKPP